MSGTSICSHVEEGGSVTLGDELAFMVSDIKITVLKRRLVTAACKDPIYINLLSVSTNIY